MIIICGKITVHVLYNNERNYAGMVKSYFEEADQSTNQGMNNSTDQGIDQDTNNGIDQSTSQSTDQPTNKGTSHRTEQGTHQSVEISVDKSTDQSTKNSANTSIFNNKDANVPNINRKTVSFMTLGCKVNQYETEAMAEAFANAGYEQVEFDEKADVYVINTCTVTGLSARKSRQAIRRAKQENPEAIVAAVGCYPQTAQKEVEALEEVDIVVGTSDRKRLPEYVEQFMTGCGSKVSTVADIMKNHVFEDLNIENYKDRTRGMLKIQEGCSQFCSYCIIPYARGPIRSRPFEDVMAEVEKLAAAGFKEIVLTGIHIASYGKDLGKIRLMDLISRIHEVDGIERIRIGSIEPTIITEEFAAAAAGLRKLCPHYHISLQSGCDETLKRMNRRYSTDEYRNVVNILRKYIPDAAITTDVMVGFPGETDEEFERTYKFLEEIEFSKMHVFKYSPRKGTPAAAFEGQVDGNVKEARSARVIKLSERLGIEYINRFVGRELPVLYEQEVKGTEGFYEGLTPNYIRVVSKGDNSLAGKIVATRLISADKEGNAEGELVSDDIT